MRLSRFTAEEVKAVVFDLNPTKAPRPDGFHFAFLSRRQIFDNVLVAFETIHPLGGKKSEKRGQMVLKLDMSKVYDRVEWNFLTGVTEKMDFPAQWINLVLDCISSSKLSLLLNGKIVCSVSHFRGQRQGCPLSPYLFLQCAEAFSGLISNSERNGHMLGIRCCRGSSLISHLFFANNSILFFKASKFISSRIRKFFLVIYEKGL
ncbi:hypothetical protein Dsin_019299 [Dipteronia sinensis]|uniref:Reverse transcriptase domain-containing protein n=1 Tax=Dipteronia sinensis TaxID=43782 RepID=A0AAE0A8C7_9ROSI|nr:hypothetical protein Dsin_019299 [Dipteronia sinensis]